MNMATQDAILYAYALRQGKVWTWYLDTFRVYRGASVNWQQFVDFYALEITLLATGLNKQFESES